MQKKILIIDDHRLFADSLSAMLNQLYSDLTVHTQHNARSLLNSVEALTDYDLLLVDLNMPSFNGFDFLKSIKNRGVKVAILVVSGSEEINDIEQSFMLGASGYVPKNLPSLEIVEAISKVLNGNKYLPPHLEKELNLSIKTLDLDNDEANQKIDLAGLRSRQIDVLSLIREGHSNSNIGTILGISESAVKSHISILFKALKVRNRTGAVKIGEELGLLNK